MNSEYNMTSEEYELLYKAYLNRDPKELLELAGMKEGDRVLDLCAGSNARATKAAVEMGASYVASVDLNPYVQQIKGKAWAHARVEPFCEDIYGYLEYTHIPKEDKFNVVICQQGVNYWFDTDILTKLRGVMKRDGSVFVFNTFNKKPPRSPKVKEYEIEGKKYVEVVWMAKEEINHVQIVDCSSPHFTQFKWFEPEYVKETCEKAHFEVEVVNKKNTDIYICNNYDKRLN